MWRTSLYIIIFITTLRYNNALAETNTNFFGVSLAGAEFGNSMPGTFGTDYTYPTESELTYYHSKGLNLIRIPFKWERMQPTLGGALNSTELDRLKTIIQQASNKGMLVIPDLHNYCRYKINGTDFLIGTSEVSIANIKDFWIKLSDALKSESNIWGYGIMNEPHDLLPTTPWKSIAQEIITGIRTKDLNTPIIVSGDSWSSAERWLTYSNNLKDLSDISNKLIFEAHVYFDKDASGSYNNSYDIEEATANTGINRVTPFVNWLSTNQLKGYIGEYGIPADDSRWLTTLDNFLAYLQQNCINGTYWAGGPWWGNYKLSIEPASNTDKVQMSIVSKYLLANTNCNTSTSMHQDKIKSTKPAVFPNPFTSELLTTGFPDDSEVKIINSYGSNILKTVIKEGKISNLDNLPQGLYFVIINNKSTFTLKK